jgi:flavin-dependent dehydrogenase
MPAGNCYQVIIVGTGPAGISTALHLANLSSELIPRTLLLEKERHPRPKLCGGGILPDAEVVLEQLGLDITSIPHVDVDWAHIDFNGKGMKMRGRKEGKFAFRTIRRPEFDAWLAAKARERGFIIHEETSVMALVASKNGVDVITNQGEFHAEVVVGADGSNSVIRKAIILSEPLHVARLLEVVTEQKPEKSFHKQSDSYFDFRVLQQGILGYVWDFPALEEGMPVRVRGIFDSHVLPIHSTVPLRLALEEELGWHGLKLSDYKLQGHPIRWFDKKSELSAPRVLLVGDAAGTDALFGEGISIALGYGAIAAQAILDAYIQKDYSFLDYKQTILKSELGKSLQRRTWLARFFYRLRSSQFQSFFWTKLGWFIEWAMRTFFIDWARRQDNKAKRT